MAEPLRDYFRNTMRDSAAIKALTAEVASPYGVYYQTPKKDITPPLITFSFPGRSRPGEVRQNIYLSITAWGNNFLEIQDAVYSLFHKKSPVLTGYRILMIKYIESSPELWDDRLQCFYRSDRYEIAIAKD